MRISKTLSIIMLIATLGLTACGDSDIKTMTGETTTAENGTSYELGYPATGKKPGIVREGVSLKRDVLGEGLRYVCASSFDSVEVPFNQGVEYNGTTIKFDYESSEFDSSLSDIDQESVTISFAGNNLTTLSTKATSLIIDSDESYTSDKGKYYPRASDDKVVRVTPAMVKRGVFMTTDDFTTGYISTVTLCVKR